ncbi:MFS transporter [Achromobacter xylosoxidans]
MPAAVYLFSLCTFAFGLSEFVVAGLVSAMAHDLLAPVQAVGGAVAAYALGAVVGAPFLTALAAGWQDRRQLALAMAALTIGSAAIGLASTLSGVLVLRFAVGLAHGVFMAVASDAATRLVGPARAGRALSLVWLGLTLALAVGVPLGTYLGSVWSWRAVFLAMAALGLLGMGGLLLLMPPRPPAGQAAGAAAALRALRHPQMLMTAGVGALVSVAVFAFFTFISPYLLQVASADARWLSLAMLLFGACTVGGNLLGGYLADGPAPDRNAQRALAALALNLCGLFLLRHSPVAVAALAGGLGLCFLPSSRC